MRSSLVVETLERARKLPRLSVLSARIDYLWRQTSREPVTAAGWSKRL